MPENAVHRLLRETFPKADKEIWRRMASQELGNKDPFENLIWTTKDELAFFPYYDESDVADVSYLKKFISPVADDSFSGPRKWLCTPLVTTENPSLANKTALDHLANGADAVLFVLTSNIKAEELLPQIDLPYCSLFFKTKSGTEFSQDLSGFIQRKKFDLNTLTGSLFWETRPKKSDVSFFLNHTKKIKSLGITIAASSSVEEIADGLTQAVNQVEDLKTEYPVDIIFSSVAFSLPVQTNFLESIAKLKALRLLWYQVSQAYQLKKFSPSDLHIHAFSNSWMSEKFEPHGNMIKGTMAAMASVLGGCDSLTIEPQDASNSSMSRIARNISSILREESHLNKVTDAVAGSYTIDSMVHAIADKAWKLFQSNMK